MRFTLTIKTFIAMKRIVYLFILLSLCGCRSASGPDYQDISVFPGSYQKIVLGTEFHCIYTTSDPVYLDKIVYEDNPPKVAEERPISRTFYKMLPYTVEWQGLKVVIHSMNKIEVWLSPDARPTSSEQSAFLLDINAIRFWYDENTIWWVDDIYIERTQPAEE